MSPRDASSAAIPSVLSPRLRTTALLHGVLAVAVFSGSLPATRVAVLQLDPSFVTAARALVAGVAAAALLAAFRERPPARAELPGLAVVAAGVVVGFPLLSSLALRRVSAAHGLVFAGLLPLSTALFGVLRAGERPTARFWVWAAAGAAAVAVFAANQGGAHGTFVGDALLVGAVLLCGLGYAEGGRLARTFGGWQVISWALVLSLPVSVPAALLLAPRSFTAVGWPALAGLAYVSLFSMLVGFVFWYRALALGGISEVSQLQLLQPLLGLALAAAVLHERVGPDLLATAAAVLLCVGMGRREATRATGSR